MSYSTHVSHLPTSKVKIDALRYIMEELEYSVNNTMVLTRLWQQYSCMWQEHAGDLLVLPSLWSGLVEVGLLSDVKKYADIVALRPRLLENTHTMALAHIDHRWSSAQEWEDYALRLSNAYDDPQWLSTTCPDLKKKNITSGYVSWTDHVLAAASMLRKSRLPHAALLWASHTLEARPEVKDGDMARVLDELKCWPQEEAHILGWFWWRRLSNNNYPGYETCDVLSVFDPWVQQPPKSLCVPLGLLGDTTRWDTSDLAITLYEMMLNGNRSDMVVMPLPSLD